MKKLWMAMLIAPAAFAQTTTTNCQRIGEFTNCTSRTEPPRATPSDAAAFTDAYSQAREQGLREQRLQQERALLRQQQENLRLQNELLRRQVETTEAPLVSEEVQAMHLAYIELLGNEQPLPESERMPEHLLSRIAINNAARVLGRKPLARSVDTFRSQIGL